MQTTKYHGDVQQNKNAHSPVVNSTLHPIKHSEADAILKQSADDYCQASDDDGDSDESQD
jgi:hypothetical protein